MRRGTTSNNNQTPPQQQPRGGTVPPSSVVGGGLGTMNNNNKNTIQPAQGRNPQQQNTTNMSSMSHGDLLDFFLSDSTSSTPTLNSNVNVNNNNMNINSINVNNNNNMMNKQNSNNNINFPNNNNINNITSSGNLKLNNNSSSNNLLIPSSSSNSLGNNSTSSTPTLGSAFNPRARSISNSGSNNQLANNVNIGATIASSTTNTVQTMKTFDDSFDASWDDTNFEQVIQVIPPKTTSKDISNTTNTQMTRPPSGNNVSNLATKSVTNTTVPVIPPVQPNKTQPSFPPSNTTVPPVVNIVASSTPISNVETPIINIMGNQSTTSAPPLQNKHLQPSGYVNPYSTPTKTPGKEDLFALHSAPEIEPPVLPSVNKTAQYTQPLTNSKSLENIVEKTTTAPETNKVIPPPIKLTQNNSASSLVLEKSPPLTIKAEPFVNPNLKNLKPGLCKHKCQIPNCVCYCAFDHSSQEYKDFIEAENGGLDFHMCSNSHPCQQFCSHRGFCEIKAEAKYNDVGLKHNCSKMLEPFKFSHSGKCLCYNDEDTKTAPRKHYCTKKCPACLSICRKEYGHDKNSFWVAKRSVDPKMKNINFETLSVKEKEDLLLHDTEHTFMINTVFVTDSKLLKNNAIEIPYIHQNQERLLRFFPGQNGAKFTCESYCRVLGRGHTYLTVCSHKHGKKLDSLNSSSSDLKATMETSEKQRSQSLLPKSTSQTEMSSLTPKNSEWSTANRIQFTTFTPTFNTKPATENVPRSRSVGSSLSDMAQPPELPSLVIESSTPAESQPSTPSISSSNNTSSTISSMTSTSSGSTGIISSGIGGVPRRSPSNTNIAGNNLESGTIISSGIGGVPKRSPSSTSVTDTPTGLIHGGGVPKSSSSNSMSDAKNKSTSPSTHNTNPSIVGSIGSLTVGGGSQIIVSPRGVPVSPRYGREDSMIITENFDDTASETEEDCPYNGELSLMATGRKHSTMKCQPMDELKHEKFWSLCGFVDPCKKACMSNEEMRQFNLCRVQKLETNSNSNTPLEYCRRHVSHQVLDCSALDYLEEVSLIAERFPAKETGCVFSPSGHLFKATPNTGIHHYIFVDVSRNMSSQDMIPSLPVFKPAGKSLKQSEKGEDYSQFSAFDNRLGAAIELVLRYLHILFKLRPSDKMTVAIFTKKTVEIIIDNEDLEYYYSVIDLITNKIKKPDNDGGYEEVFTLLVDLLAKHDPKQSKDPINRNMRPKIYLITANQLESKFSTPNFGKTASSSTGTPVWHSLGKLESLSLQRKKKKEQTKLDDIVEWYESNGINANSSAGSASEPEPYISIIKMGSEGNESTLNQILLKCKGLSTIVDSTFVSVNVNNKLTEEEKEAIKKKSGKEPALMQRLVICHMLQDLLLTHLEHNKMRLNENMRISGASSASSGKCGLLIKSVIDQMQHVDSESDSDYDSDDELANAGFGSFMIGKGHKGSPVDILEDLETVISNESNNVDSIKTLDSGSESKTSAEKQADDKQLENEKDILERENLAKEILDTERAYVTSMAKIIELYYYPLLKYLPNLISDDDKSKIFGGLLGIYKLHKILVTDLEERVNEWHKDQKIADIFIKLHQTFKLYTTFSTKYEMAIETYSKHKDNPRFRNYLYIRRKDPFSKGEQLQGFLIKPIQRIPRYILLLKGLLKHTKNPEHPDFNNLVNAISITEEVATFLNNKIRERQYFYRMKSVADRLSGLTDLIQPQRRYICEFDNLRATYDTHYNEECVVFLFNDLFIHAVRESENTQEEDGKLSRVRRKLSVKANSQPNIISTTASVPTPSVSSSTSELGGSASGVAAMKIATAEGANGIGKSDNVDVMGIMEEKKKDRYEARFVLSLGDLTVHPMDFGSNNGTKFQISAIARKFTVEYDITNRPNEKIKIITRLNDAITDFVKRKQSFQTIGQQNSTSPQH